MTDLDIISEGQNGMRKLTEVELRLVNASRQEVRKTKEHLEERTRMLEGRNIELMRSNEELEQFAIVASHDLKEPLQKIMFFSERLRMELQEPTNSRAHEYMDRIIKTSERMRRLIDDLFSYSKLDSSKEKPTLVDLNLVLQEVLIEMENQTLKEQATIQAEELPKLEANPQQMKILFQNLLSNAIKFRRENIPPEIVITSKKVEIDDLFEHEKDQSEPNFPAYKITFSDKGIGFDPIYADRIFEMFQRLHSKQTHEGSGIGLAICKKIVQHYNGKIYATSTPGQGASFHIILPEKQTSNASFYFPEAEIG